MGDYEPMIRVLKTALIGVADFGVGLVLGSIIDQGFSQAYLHFMPEVAISTSSAQTQDLQKKVCETGYKLFGQQIGPYPTLESDGVTVQNPICAPSPVWNWDQMKVAGVITLAQVVVTLIAGLELRNFFIPSENFVDPTGGIVFVMALFFQPGLWWRMETLLQSLYRAFWWLEQPKKSETGNQS
jgi:hypothetical protein